jgi:beta-lactamase class A
MYSRAVIEPMPTRRALLTGTVATAAIGLATPRSLAAGATPLNDALDAIEARSGGRLGVAVLHAGSGFSAGHRADDRFALCSTFKLLAVGAVLRRVDEGRERLDRRITFDASDLVAYSPVTKDHADRDGMTVAQLCEAAITLSDNTAANLIVVSLGGPPGVTAYARSLGDQVTRLDRIEPMLSEATPGDPRDTTTPLSMLEDIQASALGGALAPASRDRLVKWLIGNRTGDARLRAGLPPGWRCGDKTGTGEHGTANDVSILWPPQGAPLILSAYLTESTANPAGRDAALADVARAVVAAVNR